MYFHAGQDFVLNTRDVIGIFDLDTAGASKRTQEYFTVTDFPTETIYLSQLSPAALKGRAERFTISGNS